MKIEALETIKHHPFYLDEGDIKTVPDEVGDMLVGNGWARDVETGDVGERSNNPVTLDVDSAVHKQSSEVK